MNANESRALRVGDRVRWQNPDVGGEVIDAGYHAVSIKWDDGQTGTTAHDDAQLISRERAQ